MSAKSDVKEVFEFIAELMKPPPETEPPALLTKDSWERAQENLEHAGEHFITAAAAMDGTNEALALDLGREAASLAQRARTLRRRAPADTKPASTAKDAPASKAKATPKAMSKSKPSAKPKAAAKPRTVRATKALVDAADSIERARDHLDDTGSLTGAADAFAQDLDLLAEMTLNLQARRAR